MTDRNARSKLKSPPANCSPIGHVGQEANASDYVKMRFLSYPLMQTVGPTLKYSTLHQTFVGMTFIRFHTLSVEIFKKTLVCDAYFPELRNTPSGPSKMRILCCNMVQLCLNLYAITLSAVYFTVTEPVPCNVKASEGRRAKKRE